MKSWSGLVLAKHAVRAPDARECAERALELARVHQGEDSLRTLTAKTNLAMVLVESGKVDSSSGRRGSVVDPPHRREVGTPCSSPLPRRSVVSSSVGPAEFELDEFKPYVGGALEDLATSQQQDGAWTVRGWIKQNGEPDAYAIAFAS